MKLLVIEDDEFIAHALTTVLTSQNYAVEVATDGQAGWELVEAFDYDLVLLDVMLPKLDGIHLCRQIRSKGLQMPILLLTGRDSGHDKAIGLDAGADDYVVKPFDPEELVARVRALLRRGGAISQPILEWGDLRLNPSSYEVTYGTRILSLTPKEYALLELFLRNSRRVFSCGLILEHLWAYEEMPGEEAVRTHIKGLRQKLKAAGVPSDVIETVYGIGYRLKPEEKAEGRGQKAEGEGQRAEGRGQKAEGEGQRAEGRGQKAEGEGREVENAETEGEGDAMPTLFSDTAHRTADRDALAKINQPTQQKTLDSVNQIWQRFKHRVSEQVGILERSAIALEQQQLDPDLRQQARHEAHTLAGSLGTFGLPEGSHLARQIERLLQAEQPLGAAEAVNLRQWVAALRQEVERSRGGSAAESRSPSPEISPETPHASASAEQHRPLLLIVDRNRPLAQTLVAEAATWGFRGEVAANLTRARDKIFLESPDVVLLDPDVAPIAAESLSLLSDLSKQVPPIPVVIWTEHHDLTERLEVARLGGRTFLQKSVPPAQVLEAVNQVLHQSDRSKANVMVVDDDPALLVIVRSLLEPWGLKITTLSTPQQFWQVLEATSPDLLILDIEMPQIGGIELCQIVRNDSRWGSLPILFLTAHTDADTVNQVFSVGADDFVSKPIVGPELVTRIINRLERIRLSRIACGRD